MFLDNLQLTLESDGDTYEERLTICRRALATDDKQRAYEEMVDLLQQFVKKKPQHYTREERQRDVIRAAAEVIVDRLCDELLVDKEYWESLDDVTKTSTPSTPGKTPTATSTPLILPSRKVSADVLGVLQRSRLENGKVYLPNQALDRKLYTSTKDVLVAMGGKWTSGKTQAFVFAEADPASFEVAFTGLLETGSYTDPKDMSFFPTPPELVAELIELTGLKPGMTVLEPSAGRGAIALKAADIVGLANVKCFELYPPNARALERTGFSVIEQDFLAMEPPVLEADKLIVIEGRFPLEEINRCLSTTSYAKHFYEKLMAGQIVPAKATQKRTPAPLCWTKLENDWRLIVYHEYRLIVLFAENVVALLPQTVEAICHIPKYWDATDAQREQVKLLALSAATTGRFVYFKLSLDVEPAEGAAFAELAAAIAQKCNGKKFILQNSDGSGRTIECELAKGGSRADVLRLLEAIKRDSETTTTTSDITASSGDTPSC